MLYIFPKTPHDFTHIRNVRFVVRLATLCNAILLLYVRYVRFPGKSSREAEVRFPPPPDRASERFSCDCASLPGRGRTLAARRSVGRSVRSCEILMEMRRSASVSLPLSVPPSPL